MFHTLSFLGFPDDQVTGHTMPQVGSRTCDCRLNLKKRTIKGWINFQLVSFSSEVIKNNYSKQENTKSKTKRFHSLHFPTFQFPNKNVEVNAPGSLLGCEPHGSTCQC
jgi:hypothetical protein